MTRGIACLILLIGAFVVACGGDDNDGGEDDSTTPEVTKSSASGPDGGGSSGEFSSTQLPVSVTVTTGVGWESPADADLPDLFAVVHTVNPAGYVDFLQPTQVYNYASASESELSDPPADYVQWFNDNPFHTVVGTEEVTVGGLQGSRIEVTNNDNEPFALFRLSDGSDYDMSYRDHVFAYVLDKGGNQILVMCAPEDPAQFDEFTPICEEALVGVEFAEGSSGY
jgi:hypothetical protein